MSLANGHEVENGTGISSGTVAPVFNPDPPEHQDAIMQGEHNETDNSETTSPFLDNTRHEKLCNPNLERGGCAIVLSPYAKERKKHGMKLIDQDKVVVANYSGTQRFPARKALAVPQDNAFVQIVDGKVQYTPLSTNRPYSPTRFNRAPDWQKVLTTPGITVPSAAAIYTELLKHRTFKAELLNPDSGQKFGEQKFKVGSAVTHAEASPLRGKRAYVFHILKYIFLIADDGLHGWVGQTSLSKRSIYDLPELQCEPMLEGWTMIEAQSWEFLKVMLRISITDSKNSEAIGCVVRPVLAPEPASSPYAPGATEMIVHDGRYKPVVYGPGQIQVVPGIWEMHGGPPQFMNPKYYDKTPSSNHY